MFDESPKVKLFSVFTVDARSVMRGCTTIDTGFIIIQISKRYGSEIMEIHFLYVKLHFYY